MEESKVAMIKELLYDCTKDKAQSIIFQIRDSEILYVYMYNYNWNNGFEIPQMVLDSSACDLSIALLIFFSADGSSYLFDKSFNKNLPQWFSFIKRLYNSILDKKYPNTGIEFKVPLPKVQIYKLEKMLAESEKIFIKNIEGKKLDIAL